MKRRIGALLCLIALCLAAALSPAESAVQSARTTSGGVRVYQDKSTKSRALVTLKKGRKLIVLADEGDWLQVETDLGKGSRVYRGYVKRSAVKLDGAAGAKEPEKKGAPKAPQSAEATFLKGVRSRKFSLDPGYTGAGKAVAFSDEGGRSFAADNSYIPEKYRAESAADVRFVAVCDFSKKYLGTWTNTATGQRFGDVYGQACVATVYDLMTGEKEEFQSSDYANGTIVNDTNAANRAKESIARCLAVRTMDSGRTGISREALETVGSVVQFGRYEQDMDLTNGPEPIEWVVLEAQEGRSLLLSRYVLDNRPYNDEEDDVVWISCSLRTWLNKDFLNGTFTEAERGAILLSETDNSKEAELNNREMPSCRDRVFLLSEGEVRKYYRTGDERFAEPTMAAADGQEKKDSWTWWTRSVTKDRGKALLVGNGGMSTYTGVDRVYGVRPAFWIDTGADFAAIAAEAEAVALTPAAETKPAAPAAIDAAAFGTIGNTVIYGAFEQDGDPANGPEPVEWLVLDSRDGKSLLLSLRGLDTRPWNLEKKEITWEDCTLRAWLNRYFLYTAFGEGERQRILRTDVDNSREQGMKSGRPDGKDTKDSVFLLSCREVDGYLTAREDRECRPTKATLNKYSCGSPCDWWLRSPGASDTSAAFVTGTTATPSGYDGVSNRGKVVRPAIWVDLSDRIGEGAE